MSRRYMGALRRVLCGVVWVVCMSWSFGASAQGSGGAFAPGPGFGVVQQQLGCGAPAGSIVGTPVLGVPSIAVMIGAAVTLRDGSYGWGISSVVVGSVHTVVQLVIMSVDVSNAARCGGGGVLPTFGINLPGFVAHLVALGIGIASTVKARKQKRRYTPNHWVEKLRNSENKEKNDGGGFDPDASKRSAPTFDRPPKSLSRCQVVLKLYRSLVRDHKDANDTQRTEGAMRKLEQLQPRCFGTPEGIKLMRQWKPIAKPKAKPKTRPAARPVQRPPARPSSAPKTPAPAAPSGAKLLIQRAL